MFNAPLMKRGIFVLAVTFSRRVATIAPRGTMSYRCDTNRRPDETSFVPLRSFSDRGLGI